MAMTPDEAMDVVCAEGGSEEERVLSAEVQRLRQRLRDIATFSSAGVRADTERSRFPTDAVRPDNEQRRLPYPRLPWWKRAVRAEFSRQLLDDMLALCRTDNTLRAVLEHCDQRGMRLAETLARCVIALSQENAETLRVYLDHMKLCETSPVLHPGGRS